MKLGGERLGAQESVSKYLQVELSGQPCYRGMGAFYSTQGNIVIGCQKLGHVRVGGRTCPATIFETWLRSRIGLG
jgi:hypothetical protein